MKKQFCYLLAIALLLTIFVQVPVKASAKTNAVSPNEAVMVAEKFVKGISRAETDWAYDEVGQPVICYDINNVKSAYIIPFLTESKTAFYVTVSASKDKSPILSASHSELPYENSNFSEVVSSSGDLKNTKIIFVEPFDYFAEYSDKDNKTVIYDLKNGKIMDEATKKELQKDIHTPQNPQKANTAWDMMLNNSEPMMLSPMGTTYQYKDLSQFDAYEYDQTWSSYPDEACGPTAAAMILEYWYGTRGYYNIKEEIYYGSASAFINHMCSDFSIFGGTSVSEFQTGYKHHSNTEAGYSFTTASAATNYSSFQYEINNNRPVALRFASSSGHEYSFHWVAGRGYYYDPAFDPTRYIEINNSWGSRDEISFDEYSSLLTSVTIR